MKKRTNIALKVGVVGFLVVAVIFVFLIVNYKKDIGKCTKYHCDVKNFRLSTTIEIEKENKDFVKVKGNLFALFTDPLTMYDLEDNKIAYAGDAYHFITQDSHSIYVDDEFSVEMVGLFEIFGEAYDIYDKDEEKIASAKFDPFNTNGEIYDVKGNLIADFNSNMFMRDFDVRITDKCNIDEKTVLMIFCSYFSDNQYEERNE